MGFRDRWFSDPAASAVATGTPAVMQPPLWLWMGALLSVVLIWGINVPLMKIALAEMHPFAFNALRLPLSALLLGAIAYGERKGVRHRPLARATWMRIVAVGALANLLYQVLFILGLDRTTSGNVGLLIAGSPIYTAAIARASGVEGVRAAMWFALGIAFSGTVLIVIQGGGSELGGGTILGNLLVMGAMMVWATATVMSKSLVRDISPTRLAFLSTSLMLPAHLALGAPHLQVVTGLGANVWAIIVFSGLLSTGLAYAFWNLGIRHVGPSRTAVFTNLIPVITLAGGVWILGERVTPWQIGGGLLVLGGVLLMQRIRLRSVTT